VRNCTFSLTQDECYAYVLGHLHCQWLAKGQQPLQKKGNGHGIHISDYMLETRGHLVLNADDIAARASLLPDSHLHITDACKIIYPGKNMDKWWDFPRLMEQLRDAVDIFEYIHLVSYGKKVITSRIFGPDKYQQVVLVVCWGAYSSIVGML
jgi:hypothetical protein